MKVILEGICGSRAYGLDTDTSDEDRRGIYVAPTMDVLSLHKPLEVIDRTDPDIVYFSK